MTLAPTLLKMLESPIAPSWNQYGSLVVALDTPIGP
jgi:hypothetical protein